MGMKTTLALMVLSFSAVSSAHDYTFGDLAIAHPWSKEIPPNTSVSAGFMAITNKSAQNEVLLGATSPVAASVELHTHLHGDDGMMQMRPVEEIVIPAGETVELRPHSLHLMLMGLNQVTPLGETFPVTLTFQNAGEVTLDLKVEKALHH
uniref:copper chaperone PCu(A)C n=1 Tax=Thaumasiovibrio occultus TaxID=1891184 RepID=UPI000B34FF27|nr:copper chaperone PCu(A)C [Thaumasiovibrio occultus]